MGIGLDSSKLGVCTWSVDRDDPLRALRIIGGELGLRVAQVGLFGSDCVEQADSQAIERAAAAADVELAGLFVAFDGEDYASIQSIAATGGFMPDDEYAVRKRLVFRAAELTIAWPCRDVILHVGTVPDGRDSSAYDKLLARTREVSMGVESRGCRLLLETGREPARTLHAFLGDLDRPNIAVNFDTGNFVVYGSDRPDVAAVALRDVIAAVHIKDALGSMQAGFSFGRPAAVGLGDANIPRVLSKLRAGAFQGPLLIECQRELGGVAAVALAVEYVRSMIG